MWSDPVHDFHKYLPGLASYSLELEVVVREDLNPCPQEVDGQSRYLIDGQGEEVGCRCNA